MKRSRSSSYRRLNSFVRRLGYGVGATVVGVPCLSFAYAGYVYASTPSDLVSKSHTPYSIWVQSLTNFFMSRLGASSASNLSYACKDAANINEQLLLKLCESSSDTAYGRDFKLGTIRSRNDFRQIHPITNHNHYDPYIARVCKGEDNVMFQGAPRMIGETSGTSGTRKLLPVNPLQRKVFFTEGIGVTFDALIQGVKQQTNGKISWPNLQKSTKLMFRPKYSISEGGGYRVGPNSSSPDDNKTLLQLYTTPEEAWQVDSEEELLFLHCLFALLDPNIGFIESNFVSGVFNMFTCIQDNWAKLVGCIRKGKLPEDLDIDSTLREKLENKLIPNPQRADELEAIKGNHEKKSRKSERSSFARSIWPTLHTILAVETGSFAIYGQRLRDEFIGDDITIYSPLYAATEGLIGVNPHIDGKTYILHPNSMFYEFLPMKTVNKSSQKEGFDDTENESSNTLFIEQLEVGKTYEIIITNLTGLYRYRFGDVVRCVGYEGEAPIVEFAYRQGQFLNALGERTSEEAVASALSTAASKDWGLVLKDYTCVEYFDRPAGKRRPKYTIFVELMDHTGRYVNRPLTKTMVETLDRRLGESNDLYSLFRRKKRLHCVEVIPVKEGTFRNIRKAMLDSGIGPTQIKQPRVTRRQDLIQILEEGAAPGS